MGKKDAGSQAKQRIQAYSTKTATVEIQANQSDASIAVSKRGVIKISQPIEGYKVEKGVS